jgi:serine/threonine-protein kinase
MFEGRLVAGKYRIAQLVAAGSMGEVYEAQHVGIGKRVALKVLPRELASCDEMVARFRREVRAAGILESEYVVQVFDAGRDDELGLYLVTELLVGEDLEARLARVRTLHATTAAAIGYQVARGLAKAHAAGVIHRDLKPGNVFLAERDDGAEIAKIVDFGVSKTRCFESESEGDACLTAVGITLGTPDYMSPEQAQGLPDLDGRSDVWSLAATLYEALCGHPPHGTGGSAFEVMTRIVQEDPPPLWRLVPRVPAALCEVIHAGLVRDRGERTPDAAAFAQALAQAIPEARWSLSGMHPVLPVESGPPTLPAPPPLAVVDLGGELGVGELTADLPDDPPPSSAGAVQFFKRDALGTPELARAPRQPLLR